MSSTHGLHRVADAHAESSTRRFLLALRAYGASHQVDTQSVRSVAARRRPKVAHSHLLDLLLPPDQETIDPAPVALPSHLWTRAAARIRRIENPNQVTHLRLHLWACILCEIDRSIREDGRHTALVSSRWLATVAGVRQATAHEAIRWLIDAGLLREVGAHRPRRARRLTVPGGPRTSAVGRVIADDPTHVLRRAQDAQVGYHSDRVRAVRAWAAEVWSTFDRPRRIQGDSTVPGFDRDAAERRAQADTDREDALVAGRREVERQMAVNERVRGLLGPVPHARSSKTKRNAWLSSVRPRFEAASIPSGTVPRARRAVCAAMRIRGHSEKVQERVADMLVSAT